MPVVSRLYSGISAMKSFFYALFLDCLLNACSSQMFIGWRKGHLEAATDLPRGRKFQTQYAKPSSFGRKKYLSHPPPRLCRSNSGQIRVNPAESGPSASPATPVHLIPRILHAAKSCRIALL
jgi:hypothetical protein